MLLWTAEHWFQLSVLAALLFIAIRLRAIQYTIEAALSSVTRALTYEMRHILANSESSLPSRTPATSENVEQTRDAICWKLDELSHEVEHATNRIDQSIQSLREEVKGAAYLLEHQLEALDISLRR
jgi:peptidoglycan hydrolase CwlO-like protein